MPRSVIVSFGLTLFLAINSASGRETCTSRGEAAFVSSVNERVELLLKGGRQVKIAGVDIPLVNAEQHPRAAAARATLATWLVGHPVRVDPVGKLDRWGRIVADVFAQADFAAGSGEPDVAVAFVLVDAGLARAKPSQVWPTCAGGLIAGEATAREGRLGLWGDEYFSVLQADDEPRLAAHAGQFVIVEGQVTRIGRGRTRVFLNFGSSNDAFTAVLGKSKQDVEGQLRVRLDDLKGVRLRIRGTLDIRFGPRIEVLNPDQIERL